jgi:hypothetical protein
LASSIWWLVPPCPLPPWVSAGLDRLCCSSRLRLCCKLFLLSLVVGTEKQELV